MCKLRCKNFILMALLFQIVPFCKGMEAEKEEVVDFKSLPTVTKLEVLRLLLLKQRYTPDELEKLIMVDKEFAELLKRSSRPLLSPQIH